MKVVSLAATEDELVDKAGDKSGDGVEGLEADEVTGLTSSVVSAEGEEVEDLLRSKMACAVSISSMLRYCKGVGE